MDEIQRDEEVLLLAAALYEIRVLLTGRVGARDKSPETAAAAIAYALHNDALAVLEGRSFDIEAAWNRLRIVDGRLSAEMSERLRLRIGALVERSEAP